MREFYTEHTPSGKGIDARMFENRVEGRVQKLKSSGVVETVPRPGLAGLITGSLDP